MSQKSFDFNTSFIENTIKKEDAAAFLSYWDAPIYKNA